VGKEGSQSIIIYFSTNERKSHFQEHPYLFQNNISFVIHPYIVQFEKYTLRFWRRSCWLVSHQAGSGSAWKWFMHTDLGEKHGKPGMLRSYSYIIYYMIYYHY